MNLSQARPENGEIYFAEFLLFPSNRPVQELAEILQSRLGLPHFSYGENDRPNLGIRHFKMVSNYIVSSYADPESWHESLENTRGGPYLSHTSRKGFMSIAQRQVVVT